MRQVTAEQAQRLADSLGIKLGAVSAQKASEYASKVTGLTASVFYTDFIDTINLSKNPFDIFGKRDVMFGNGVRYIGTGVIESQEYASGKYTPTEMGCKDVSNFEDFSKSFIASTYTIKYTQLELVDFFKNADNFANYLNRVRSTIDTSYELERLEMWLYIFGKNDADLPAYMKTELDKTKNGIVNTVAFGAKADMKEVFTDIVKLSQKMGAQGFGATSDYNIGFTNGSGEKKNKSVASQDLVLIISNEDLLDLSKESANIYHQSFYQGDNKFYKVIEANIPKGTAYLVDKESLRLNPKLSETISMLWLDGTFTIASHIFSYLGTYKYGNGCKITYSITPAVKASIPAPKTESKQDTPEQEENKQG